MKSIITSTVLLALTCFSNIIFGQGKVSTFLSTYDLEVTDTFYAELGKINIPNNQHKVYIFQMPDKKVEMVATGDSISIEGYTVLYKIKQPCTILGKNIPAENDVYIGISALSNHSTTQQPSNNSQQSTTTIPIHTIDGGIKLNKTVPTN